MLFVVTFNTLVKVVVVPAITVFFLSRTFLDIAISLLGVNIVLSVLVIPHIFWNLIKLVPHMALMRRQQLWKTAIEIGLESLALVGFWAVYFVLTR